MTRKRQGRAGFFKGASLTRYTQSLPAADPQSALAALKGIVYEWDVASDALTFGPNACKVLGIPAEALPRTGRAFTDLIEPDCGLSDRNAAILRDDGRDTYDLRYALRFATDHVVLVQDAGRKETDGVGLLRAARGFLRAERASDDSMPDAIRRRSALLGRLNADITEALRFSHSFTVIIGTMDDADHGPIVDRLARALRPMMRRRDALMALASNRFALVLASCAAWDAASAMKRLAGLAAATDLPVTLGAASAPDHALEAAGLLRLAERALDAASTEPGSAVLHDPRRRPFPVSKGSPDPIEIVHALNERRLTLALQPVADARTRNAAFALARPLVDTSAATGAPLGKLPALKGANLPLLVDGRVLELAADHLARRPEARVSFAIAPATLRDDEWLTMLAAHLGARPGIESRLLVEVPECVLRQPGAARGRLDAMKALGIGIVLSGFGSGHASLAQLRHLPIDLLKIDGVFVQVLARSIDDRLFVRRLVDIAQHLGIATIADGVDDEASARKLADWGVDYLQGAVPGLAEPLPLPGLPPLRARA